MVDDLKARLKADELVSRALKCHEEGLVSKARDLYESALRESPGHSVALRLLACLEAAAGRANVAGDLFRRVAEDDPGNVTNWLNLGIQLRKFGLLEEALHCFDEALVLWPSLLPVQRRRAETIGEMEDPARARAGWVAFLAACDDAVADDLSDTETNFFRGLALLNLERTGEAIAVFLPLVTREETRADYPMLSRAASVARGALDQARMGFAGDVRKVLDLVEAVCHFRQVASARPSPAAAYSMLGLVLGGLGFTDEAIECFQCIDGAPADVFQARTQVGYALLSRGDFARGWAEYEHRLFQPSVAWTNRDFGCPAWDGDAPVAGRKVLVWAEQGLGDALQFSRYASELAAHGAEVILEVHPPLVRLLRSLRGVSEVLPFHFAPPGIELHCPLMSLPHLLRRHVRGIPADDAYLFADAADIDAWAPKVPEGINVGIAWTGNAAHGNDFRRSMRLKKLLAHLPSAIRWWCVQKDVRESDAAALAAAGVQRPALEDFAGTAALMAHLDAVVSVDTSVAHLAGALGRPTLLLLPFAAEWRWQHKRTDTPWYPTMRLFRQAVPDDWDSALVSAGGHLHGMVGELKAIG